jgi:hypothetical protein
MENPTGNRGLIGRVFDLALGPDTVINRAGSRWTRWPEVPKMVSKPSRMDDSTSLGQCGRIWE